MIDIIIPCAKRDAGNLYKTIPSLREYVCDDIFNICVIGPSDIYEVTEDLNCKFVDELEFMGFSKHCINIPKQRQGWVYQQLIKLCSDKISQTEDFLVCDADHILLKPHRFVEDGKYNFYTIKDYHKPYFEIIKRLLGDEFKKENDVSFISDKMIFNKTILKEIRSHIEKRFHGNWIKAIIKNYNKHEVCGLSEFELYGVYMLIKHPDKFKTTPTNRLLALDDSIPYRTLSDIKAEYQDKCDVLTHAKPVPILYSNN